MPDLAEAIAKITAPGQRFEIETVDVRGVPTKAFVQRPKSLRELSELAVALRGDGEFLVYGDQRYSFASFFEHANSASNGLLARGVGKGDRVAILSANNPQWAMLFWASLNIGAVPVACNGWWKPDEVAYALAHSGATVLVADRPRLDRIADDLAAHEDLDHVFVIDPGSEPLPADDRISDVADLLSTPTAQFPDVAIGEDDPSAILYTSGTTGRPKGAVATHRSWIAATHNVGAVAAVTAMTNPDDVAPSTKADVRLVAVPFFHVSGSQAHLVSGLLAGWKLVIPEGRFDPVDAMRQIEAEGITAWAAVPTMVSRLCQHPDRHEYDLSGVRSIGYGGSPKPAGLDAMVAETFPNVAYQANIYGLTETSGVATLIGGQSHAERPTSVGRGLLTVDIEVRSPDGQALPTGEVGEICIAGPLIFAGYWNDPEATAKTVIDGWLLTGDLGFVDEDGYLYVTDRSKDMIIRGGENIYSIEIEDRLVAHPAVLEVAVIGLPHDDLGEQVAAVVQSDDESLTADQLRQWVAETLANFKVPAVIDIRSEPLPRTETGKVQKTVLRSELAES